MPSGAGTCDRNEIGRLVNGLVSASFPRLIGKRIVLLHFPFRRSYAAAIWVLPWMRVILLGPKVARLPAGPLCGLLAHELCHHDRSAAIGWIRYVATLPFVYLFSRDGITKEENETDALTIEKGYGRQLYELTRIMEQEHDRVELNAYYMSSDDILKYMEEAKKRVRR